MDTRDESRPTHELMKELANIADDPTKKERKKELTAELRPSILATMA